jgi:hypothetical protein
MTPLDDLLHQPQDGPTVYLDQMPDRRPAPRRRLGTVIAGAAVIAVLGSLAWWTATHRPATNPPAPAGSTTPANAPAAGDTPLAKYGVDSDLLLGDGNLFTRDGHRYTLGDARFVWGVPAGWIYELNGSQRLLRRDGTTIALPQIKVEQHSFEQPPVAVVSADGQRVAWVTGTTLNSAWLAPAGLEDITSTPVPADSFAATWIGRRVVVGRSYGTACCGFRQADYDVWDPTRGIFVDHWTKDLAPVYGPVPEGVPAFALTPKNPADKKSFDACLARVDGVTGMTVNKTACLPGLAYSSLMGALAPDGRHLEELGPDEKRIIVDLTTVVDHPVAIGTCPGSEGVGWENNSSFLIRSGGTVTRCALKDGAIVTDSGPTPSSEIGSTVRLVPQFV